MRTVNNGDLTSYGVNGLDERVSKSTGTSKYYYIYAGVGQLLGIYDSLGQPIEELAWMADKPVSTVRGNDVYSIESDNLSTPTRILDVNRIF